MSSVVYKMLLTRHTQNSECRSELAVIFPIIGKKARKNNQISVSDGDREIPTPRSTNNAGNSVNPVSDIIRLSSGRDFSVYIGDL